MPAEPPKGRKRKRVPKSWDPTPAECADLDRMLLRLETCRGSAGWPTRRWHVKRAQCLDALQVLRARSLEHCKDAISATCWYDATQGPDGLRDGKHATLPRIFGPSKADKVERWIDDWTHAGRPDPSPPTPTRGKHGQIGPSEKFSRV